MVIPEAAGSQSRRGATPECCADAGFPLQMAHARKLFPSPPAGRVVTRPAPSLDEARLALREKFGFADFLPGQAEILESVLAGRDVLAVLPTGAGKSLLYQLPAAMGIGLVVVVSPLVSLMRDQLRALAEKGVPAATLHSAQNDAERATARAAVASGRAKLLYLAPEGLAGEGAPALLRQMRVALVAVDEAHCVSDWGHEFRPEYGRLREVAAKLGDPPILAVTASAGPRTRGDIAQKIFARTPQIFIGSFAAKNLSLAFAEQRHGLAQLADFVAAQKGGSGIVYCGSRAKVDRLAGELRRLGVDALPYHAGLDAERRAAHQDAFFGRPGVAIVATIAFGMGIDKPDARYVAHMDMPDSVEGYYQEIGRAGRDGRGARTLLLFDRRELARRLAPPAFALDERAEAEHARRRAMARLCIAPGCRTQAMLAEFGEASRPCGLCDHCRGLLAPARRLGSFALGMRLAAEAKRAALFGAEANAPLGEEPEEEPAPESFAPSPSLAPLTVAQERVLRALEAERKRLARVRGVAPRRIASDAALRELARGAAAAEGIAEEDARIFLRRIQPE